MTKEELEKEAEEWVISNTEIYKAYNEAEELLDKQIEATYKVVEENKELKTRIDNLKVQFEYSENYGKRVQKERHRMVNDNAKLKEKLTYAKTIIQDLLNNTDEYARQRAEDFLKENK